MRPRRILSLWFPRLAAERVLRAEPQLAEQPLAVVADLRGALVLASLDARRPRRRGSGAAWRSATPARSARRSSPGPTSRAAPRPSARALRRWAGRFTPWVAEEEAGGAGRSTSPAARTSSAARRRSSPGSRPRRRASASRLRLGLADTLGAAWAVARYAGAGTWPPMPATRSTRRRAPPARGRRSGAGSAAGRRRRAAAGGAGCRHRAARRDPRRTSAPLPVAALRLAPEEVAALQALGLRRIVDLAALPRAAARPARRPRASARRLDQALGRAPEPVSPAPPPPVFALRLTFPEPIGREEDVLAGIDRLLPPLCARLRAAGRGARRVRLTLVRTDGTRRAARGRARPARRPAGGDPRRCSRSGSATIDAGFGIEVMRLEATGDRAARPAPAPRPARGRPRPDAARASAEGLADLLGRIGARLGLEALVRLHPADSHIPEKAATEMAAAFTAPARRLAAAGGAAADPALPARAADAPDDGAPPPARLRLAPPAAPPRRRLRPGADHPRMVARRPGLALRARATTGGSRPRRARGSGSTRPRAARLPPGWFAQGLFA